MAAVLLAGLTQVPASADDNLPDPEDAAAGVENPAPAGPPSAAVLRLEHAVSLRDMVQRLDAAIPRRTGSPDTWVSFNDTLEVRYMIERDSLRLELTGYDFVLSYSGHYWLYTRAKGGAVDFGEAHCGSPGEPIGLTMGFRGRIGWNDDWRLGLRLNMNADIFELRCKPKPPNRNFTKFLERNIQKDFQQPLGALIVAEVERFDPVSSMVASTWNALSAPQDLFDGTVWLDWRPREVQADPAGGRRDMLDLRFSYIVEPVLRVGEPGATTPAPLPPPNVRVADDHVKIPVDVTLSLDDMEKHIAARLAQGEGNPFASVGGLSIGGQGSRLDVEVLAGGGASTDVRLQGKVRFDDTRSAIEVKDLAWTGGSEERCRTRFKGLDPAALKGRLEREFAFDVSEELIAKRQLIPKALNRTLDNGFWTEGAMLGFVPQEPVLEGRQLLLRHWAYGPAWIRMADGASN